MELAQEIETVTGAGAEAHGEPLITLEYEGVTITILGTAHVSRSSADTVRRLVSSGNYDAVALELCENRYQALIDPDAISKMDLVQVFRKGRGPMVMASLALGAFQQRIADQLGVEVGAEMRAAISAAAERELPLMLIDRDIGTTLKRIYRNVPLGRRFKLLTMLIASIIARRTVSEEEIEQLKQGDVLESTFNQFAEEAQDIYQPLVSERDEYMVAKLMQAARAQGHTHILAVVGAGHLKGMRQGFNRDSEQYIREPAERQRELEQVPAASRWPAIIPWAIVATILFGFVLAFMKGSAVGWAMVEQWVIINGTLSAIGAMLAFAHPVSIISAFVAAPITSLNPAISVGMVSAAVETRFRKPSVGDFSRLRSDVCHLGGWWSNRVAHTFVVFFLSGVGGVMGTYFASYKIFETVTAV